MPKYYPINEEAAKRAKDMNSFSDYQPGSLRRATGQWSMKRMRWRNAESAVSIPCTTIRLTLWWIAMPGNLRKISMNAM